MARSPVSYSQSQYYLPSPREESPYSTSPIVLHHPHPVAHHMQPQQHHDSIPIDPALSMYQNAYYPFQQQAPPPMSHPLMTASLSSPSSQGSETMGTPPMEQYQLHGMNLNGKRPSSSMTDDSRKKSRKEDEGEGPSMSNDKEEVKAKPTRGSRYVDTSPRRRRRSVSLQRVHRLPTPEDEVRRRRARTTVQAVSNRQPRMHIRGIQPWQAVDQVRMTAASAAVLYEH